MGAEEGGTGRWEARPPGVHRAGLEGPAGPAVRPGPGSGSERQASEEAGRHWLKSTFPLVVPRVSRNGWLLVQLGWAVGGAQVTDTQKSDWKGSDPVLESHVWFAEEADGAESLEDRSDLGRDHSDGSEVTGPGDTIEGLQRYKRGQHTAQRSQPQRPGGSRQQRAGMVWPPGRKRLKPGILPGRTALR